MKVSFTDVITSIRNENKTISGGNIISNGFEKNIRILGEIESPDELYNIVVKDDGGEVYLRDVAKVNFHTKDATTFARNYGEAVVMLDVKKRAGKNMIEAVEKIKSSLMMKEKTISQKP